MTEDVECPYCGKWQEINHDDGYGYEEGKTYEQECCDCYKVFVYTTSISFFYDAIQAPCLNGGEHDWIDSKYFIDRKMCSNCGKERTIK